MTDPARPPRFSVHIDEDSQATAVLVLLRAAGVDVSSSKEAGLDGQPDHVQLAFAVRESRAVFTSNIRDFTRLHKEYQQSGASHGGIILWVRERYSVGEQARRILRLWQVIGSEEMRNRQEFLGDWGEPDR